MNLPLISVVITTHKRSDKIQNAIESVIKQTYNNLEIIIVDDNSNNLDERQKTEAIVKKYSNIKLIHNQANLGGALSRNVGIDNSNGVLISFLDDDDEYLPTRIEEMYACYLQHQTDNVGLIYCSCDRIDDNRNILGSYSNNYNGRPLYNQMLNCIAGTSTWLVPKAVLEKIGKFEAAPCKQDSIVLLKMLANNYQVFSVNKSLVLYYEHGGTGISGTKLKNIEGLKNYRTWCRKYYDKLDSRHQRRKVESNFSKNLITLYIINNMKKQALSELLNIFKNDFFSINCLKSTYKIFFTKSYLKKIKHSL